MTYMIYGLADPRDKGTRYIGVSINVLARFARHLSCNDENEEKNDWIRELAVEQFVPHLFTIEQVETRREALDREQYWIRYCMERGIELYNLAITMTSAEKENTQQERAIRYEQITEVLRSGTYVKWCGGAYAGRLLGPYDGPIGLCNRQDYFFVTESGKCVSIREASDQEFDAFIHRYIPVDDYGIDGWDGEDRYQAVNFALSHHGDQVHLTYDPQIKRRDGTAAFPSRKGK